MQGINDAGGDRGLPVYTWSIRGAVRDEIKNDCERERIFLSMMYTVDEINFCQL